MTLSAIMLVLHIAAVVIWVGGMIFAHQMLRPVVADVLEPPQRLKVWGGVFGRFFPWVWAAVITLPVTGWVMIETVLGGAENMPVYVHIMYSLGLIMMVIFAHLFFGPYKRLKTHVAAEAWPDAAAALAKIRRLVGINILLGLATIATAAGGRMLG